MRRPSRLTAISIAVAVVLLGYTKLVWQSGFDQGADVMLCTVAAFQQGGDPVTIPKDHPSCQRAKAGERNPLWLLRRRG